jgi:putative phosphoribosyl transferase
VVELVENSELRDKIHVFDDRSYAGELLAELLQEYQGRTDVIILAIPAGGVPVALQVPWNREAGFGAVSWDGSVIVNKPLVDSLGLSNKEINRCVKEEKQIIYSRLKKFRGNVPFPVLEGKVVIVVDDGLASGFSMLATVKALRKKARWVVVAVPTAPVSAINRLKRYVDQIVCLNIRSGPFFAVAEAYKDWYDLDDEDVIHLLENVL